MRCENCGATASLMKNNMRQCLYCGSIYHQSNSNETKAKQTFPSENKKPNPKTTGCLSIVFLIACMLLAVAGITNKQTHWGDGLLAGTPDYLQSDTQIVVHGTPKVQDADIGKNAQRVNPDPLFAIKDNRVYQSKYATTIGFTTESKIKLKIPVDTIYFNFKLFDKNGLELKSADTVERKVQSWIYGEGTETFEIPLIKADPRVTKAIPVLRKIKFENFTWTYLN